MRKQMLRLHVDAKRRVTIGKLLPAGTKISSVRAFKEGSRIILEPMAEIPAEELWTYENPKIYASFRKGLSENATIDLGSFSKYADEEI